MHKTSPTSKSFQHILITGGCGFIGLNLVKKVIKNKLSKRIRILDNLSVGTREDIESVLAEFGKFNIDCNGNRINYNFKDDSYPSVELLIGSIISKEVVETATIGIDIIVHLAANTGVGPSVENPLLDMESNVIGTVNLLEVSRNNGISRFIFASSGAPLGEQEPPINEQKVPRPVSPYGASKLAGEGYCFAYHGSYGLKTVILRFSNVYGPRSKHKNSVIAKFFKRAIQGLPLEIYGTGNQARDFIYIDDLIQAIMLSIKSDIGGEVFQIATYKETTVNEIAEQIKKLVENETEKKVNIIHGKPRLGDVKRNYSDITKAKKVLGYEPEYDLRKGLKHTFEYFTVDAFKKK